MTAIPTFGVPEILVQDEGGDDVTQARKLDVPSLSVTPVDHDPSDTVEALGVGRASANDSSPSSGLRERSSSIQLSPVASPTRHGFNLSPRHRPTASSSSIQPDWHFAAAMEGAARPSPPGSPRLSDTDATAARSRANSAVSQHDMLGMFSDSAWGQSMRRSFTTKRPDDQRRPSS